MNSLDKVMENESPLSLNQSSQPTTPYLIRETIQPIKQ